MKTLAAKAGSRCGHAEYRTQLPCEIAAPQGKRVQRRNGAVEVERIAAMQHVAKVEGELVEVHRLLADHENCRVARYAHAVADLARVRMWNEGRMHHAMAQQQRARLGRQPNTALRKRRIFRRFDHARPGIDRKST